MRFMKTLWLWLWWRPDGVSKHPAALWDAELSPVGGRMCQRKGSASPGISQRRDLSSATVAASPELPWPSRVWVWPQPHPRSGGFPELGRWDGVGVRTWQELQDGATHPKWCHRDGLWMTGGGALPSPESPSRLEMCHLPPQQPLHFSTALLPCLSCRGGCPASM